MEYFLLDGQRFKEVYNSGRYVVLKTTDCKCYVYEYFSWGYGHKVSNPYKEELLAKITCNNWERTQGVSDMGEVHITERHRKEST